MNQNLEIFWRETLSDFRDSNLTLRKYCLERNLVYRRALYWKRRLASPEDSALSFALVKIPKELSSEDSGVSIECGNRLIRLNNKFDESVLLRVVSLLYKAEV